MRKFKTCCKKHIASPESIVDSIPGKKKNVVQQATNVCVCHWKSKDQRGYLNSSNNISFSGSTAQAHRYVPGRRFQMHGSCEGGDVNQGVNRKIYLPTMISW